MELVKNLYLRAYLLVMTLYVFLNKGVAYTYLVEALWLFGILLLLMHRKKVELILNVSHPQSNRSVPDPYYGGMEGFEEVYTLLNEVSLKIISSI